MATLQPQKIAVFEPSHGCVRVQRPIRHKVFVHSAPKTATSQLGYYLARLGYRVSGWMGAGITIYKWEARISATNRLFDKTTCPLPGERLATANATLASLQRFAAPDDAFHDSPLGHIFTHNLHSGLTILAKAALWPQARFIWSDRPAAHATLSYFRWVHGGEAGIDPDPGQMAISETPASQVLTT